LIPRNEYLSLIAHYDIHTLNFSLSLTVSNSVTVSKIWSVFLCFYYSGHCAYTLHVLVLLVYLPKIMNSEFAFSVLPVSLTVHHKKLKFFA
jgi:hypothetical protein